MLLSVSVLVLRLGHGTAHSHASSHHAAPVLHHGLVCCDHPSLGDIHQRQDLEKEELLLFPAAIKALWSEDWAEIDARLDDRPDPLFDSVIEDRFHKLQETILRWEEETEEARTNLSPNSH